MLNHSSDIAEFESILALDNPIKSSVMPRWQRKLAQAEKSDRFIPNRSGMDTVNSLNDENVCNAGCEAAGESDYQKMLNHEVLDKSDGGSRILAFKNKAPTPKEGYQSTLKILYSQKLNKKADLVKPSRHISSSPVRILDAPDILDDYYLNLLSWSSENVLAVALSQTVYLWDAAAGSIKELMSLDQSPDDYVSSVSWIQQGGTHLAIGTASNAVQLWDVQAGKQVRSMNGHSERVGSLSWNSHILTSGSKDTTIIDHDVRVQQHVINKYAHHSQEVCGLTWSPDGSYLSSGSNDNSLCVWESGISARPRHVLTDHQAAVKALSWSPHERNLLASGGGTADRCIKFWNAASGSLLNSVDTGSQVCALQWSPIEKEILSSHGYAENQLCLWKYPTMVRTKELKGHTARVLHMATSPDGSMVVSGAADETLRFWNVFGSSESTKRKIGAVGGGEMPTVMASLSRSNGLKIR